MAIARSASAIVRGPHCRHWRRERAEAPWADAVRCVSPWSICMYRFLRSMAMVFALLGGAAAAAVAFLTVASIAGRAIWSAPIAGDIEITQFGIAMGISLCLPWCQLHGGNIIVDFFTTRAKP